MDLDDALLQDAQAPVCSKEILRDSEKSRNDQWNKFKDDIYRVYIREGNTLKLTMQVIEGQGGPKASKRTWRSKVKEWAYEKNLTSDDMNAINAKAEKRKRDEGKETRFRKAANTLEPAPITAATPPNVRYHTPRPEDQTNSNETQGDPCLKPSPARDGHPQLETPSLTSGNLMLDANSIDLFELDTMAIARDEVTETFFTNLQDTTIDLQQGLQFLTNRVSPISPSAFLQSSFNQGSPSRSFSDIWIGHDFDQIFDNLNQTSNPLRNFDQISASWDSSAFEGLDTFSHGNLETVPSVGEVTAVWSMSLNSSISRALHDIPWFRFQQLAMKSGSFGHNSRLKEVSHLFTPNLGSHSAMNLVHCDVDLDERHKLLSSLIHSPPSPVYQDILPKFLSKL
ncbi:hypothetical protein EG329_000685 [Mollisiaceae sp. DMI_Dod_QoI]|nr:hypothetical protein EG329_000685 [Helotiales sp. DMI_Dod_QoI]